MQPNMQMRRFASRSPVLRNVWSLLPDQDGMTLVEVIMAILIFTIVMVGGLNYYTLPQAVIHRAKVKRLAVAAAHQRMETLMAMSYASLTTDLNGSATIDLGGTSVTRSTTVTEVDDDADGTGLNDNDANTVDYKMVTIEISWDDGNARKITLRTKVSEFGK